MRLRKSIGPLVFLALTASVAAPILTNWGRAQVILADNVAGPLPWWSNGSTDVCSSIETRYVRTEPWPRTAFRVPRKLPRRQPSYHIGIGGGFAAPEGLPIYRAMDASDAKRRGKTAHPRPYTLAPPVSPVLPPEA
jgi:hypothetical protein